MADTSGRRDMVTVIGAGLPRTGTSSMKAALERLGFGPCHHMFDILTTPGRADRWAPLGEGRTVDWEHLLDGFRSAVDWPVSHFWRELAREYPDAKVILTVRDRHAWYASMRNLILNGPARGWPDGVPEAAAGIHQTVTTMGPVIERMARETFGETESFMSGLPDEPAAVEAFERHSAAVRAGLPPERLLEFDVRQGWEPLCRFLGVDVPAEPFPHLNDGKSMQQIMERLMAGDAIASPFG